jgi:hypothetical protein
MNLEDEKSALKVKEDCTYGNKTPLNARRIVEAILALRTRQGLIAGISPARSGGQAGETSCTGAISNRLRQMSAE